jgi:hypothetical protein
MPIACLQAAADVVYFRSCSSMQQRTAHSPLVRCDAQVLSQNELQHPRRRDCSSGDVPPCARWKHAAAEAAWCGWAAAACSNASRRSLGRLSLSLFRHTAAASHGPAVGGQVPCSAAAAAVLYLGPNTSGIHELEAGCELDDVVVCRCAHGGGAAAARQTRVRPPEGKRSTADGDDDEPRSSRCSPGVAAEGPGRQMGSETDDNPSHLAAAQRRVLQCAVMKPGLHENEHMPRACRRQAAAVPALLCGGGAVDRPVQQAPLRRCAGAGPRQRAGEESTLACRAALLGTQRSCRARDSRARSIQRPRRRPRRAAERSSQRRRVRIAAPRIHRQRTDDGSGQLTDWRSQLTPPTAPLHPISTPHRTHRTAQHAAAPPPRSRPPAPSLFVSARRCLPRCLSTAAAAAHAHDSHGRRLGPSAPPAAPQPCSLDPTFMPSAASRAL